MSEELQPVFSIEKLYVKDMSLEVPHAPKIFLEQGEPEVDMRVKPCRPPSPAQASRRCCWRRLISKPCISKA